MLKQMIAKQLLEIGAVALKPQDPFTWASGMKSPIYCDNRLTLSYPSIRRGIAEGLTTLIRTHFQDVEVVAGTATAGIPHAAWVSDQLECPLVYVRSSAKGHGKGNQIEGKIDRGQKVVVIEDLISTGGSVIKAVEALRTAGCEVLGVVAIFTYQLDKGKELLAEAGIEIHTLSDFTTLVEVASEQASIDKEMVQQLLDWRKDPANWQLSVK